MGEENCDADFADVTCEGGSLSLGGRELVGIPSSIAQKFGACTTHLDLSYNNMSSMKKLNVFEKLDTLVLDNNEVRALFFE